MGPNIEYGALVKRAAIGAAIGGVISLWTCQNDFSWKGPFGGSDLNGGGVAGSIILGAVFGPIVPATFAGLCLAGAADGAAGHVLNAWLTDADASIKDGGVGCAIALLTAGIGNIIKRARNAIGNNGPTTNPDGPGTRGGTEGDGDFTTTRENDAGGDIYTSDGAIDRGHFQDIVEDAIERGDDVTILSGAHGDVDGNIVPEREFFDQDVDAFGDLPRG